MAGAETIVGLFSTGAKVDALKQRWLRTLVQGALTGGQARVSQDEIARRTAEFLDLLAQALRTGGADTGTAAYASVRGFLEDLSRSQAAQGYSSSDTANFVFSLKQPVFEQLAASAGADAQELSAGLWAATQLLDSLGLHTVKTYQVAREEVIRRQQEEMLELSTPVVKLWDGVLALPLIGTLDSSRTQIVMESLLQTIVETGSQIAIIDITGVSTVDTLVAQHLLKTVAAAKLMGADCIISGIRPQIAQTIVHLGIALGDVVTKGSLADAFKEALDRIGMELRPRLAAPR
jgi:rsbT co-antagonist protein RsbR